MFYQMTQTSSVEINPFIELENLVFPRKAVLAVGLSLCPNLGRRGEDMD